MVNGACQRLRRPLSDYWATMGRPWTSAAYWASYCLLFQSTMLSAAKLMSANYRHCLIDHCHGRL